MNELLTTIDEITKYGLAPNLSVPDRYTHLERNLIKIYSLYFDIKYTFDEAEYPDFDDTLIPDIVQNVKSNFPEFGFYRTVLEVTDIESNNNYALGAAMDDLSDIIHDLLEIKWRIEKNSLNDGLWFFEFIFRTHTQHHILRLLNYIKQSIG